MHVVISGAGPTGLTAAVELARRGVEVSLFEKHDNPSPHSRAVGILPRSMQILQPSGVADAILAEAILFKGANFHVGSRLVAQLPLGFDADSRILGLAQDRTEAHLEHALRRLGVEVRYGVAVEGLEQDDNGVDVRTADGTIRADYLVGADGVRSTVREALALPFKGFDLPNEWSIADVEALDWPDADRFNAFLLEEGDVCVVVPLEEARFRVIASRPDALRALPVPMDVRRVRRRGAFTISVRQVTRYQVGRVFLAGDAAHCHSPVGGRGMNLGIADAADLAERLISGREAGYHAARHETGKRVIALSERGRRMLNTTSRLRRGFVVNLLRLGVAVPPLGRALMRQAATG